MITTAAQRRVTHQVDQPGGQPHAERSRVGGDNLRGPTSAQQPHARHDIGAVQRWVGLQVAAQHVLHLCAGVACTADKLDQPILCTEKQQCDLRPDRELPNKSVCIKCWHNAHIELV